MDLVPGVFVHSGLRRLQTVFSEQHQPEVTSRRRAGRKPVLDASSRDTCKRRVFLNTSELFFYCPLSHNRQ